MRSVANFLQMQDEILDLHNRLLKHHEGIISHIEACLKYLNLAYPEFDAAGNEVDNFREVWNKFSSHFSDHDDQKEFLIAINNLGEMIRGARKAWVSLSDLLERFIKIPLPDVLTDVPTLRVCRIGGSKKK